MRKAQFLLICCLLLGIGFVAEAQKVNTSKPQKQNDVTATEREIRDFFDSYAEDLRRHRREAIANRYDSRGYFRLGNGNKRFVSFEDTKTRYLTRWTGPKAFEWKDLSVEVLSSDAAVVTGLFDWETASGQKATFSYTGLLIKQAGKWRIRVEDESVVPPADYTISKISGDRSSAGPFKESMTAHAGASIAAHRHTADMHITVLLRGGSSFSWATLKPQGFKFFEEGSSFVIPAGVLARRMVRIGIGF